MSELASSAPDPAAAAVSSLRQEGSVVLGIVVEVPQPWGDDLQQWRLGFGDNFADHMPTHITIVAPVTVPSGQLDEILADIDSLCAAMPRFHVATAGVESFRPVSPVVYLAVGDGSEHLGELHDRLLPAVSPAPPLHPYVPHITLAMHLPAAVLDAAAQALSDYEATWEVTEVSSYLRGRDGRWLPLAAHLLKG